MGFAAIEGSLECHEDACIREYYPAGTNLDLHLGNR